MHIHNPQDPKVRGQSLQSEPADLGLSPRRSHSYNGTDSLEHWREDQNQDLHHNTKDQDPLQSKRQHMEIGTSGYATSMAENIKPITVHIRQDLHSQLGLSAK